MRHLVSLYDLTRQDLDEIFDLARNIKDRFRSGERPRLLQGRVLTLLFEKPSLRTRISFEAGMMQLGGSGIFLSARDAGLNGREALCDIARVLSGYCDAVALRTFSQKLIEEFAQHAACPVINALSDERHPCQALTDLFTLQEFYGDLSGRRLAFVGDGNNVARSLAIGAAMMGVSMVHAAPPGYELKADFLADLKRRMPTADVRLVSDPREAVQSADVVYTDVWASMGQESEQEERKRAFANYQVNGELMALAPAECRFMHDLPARRGLEVTDEVIDGPRSVVFEQAENRLHLAKGLLVWLLRGR